MFFVQDDIYKICMKKSVYRLVDRIEVDGGEDLNKFEEIKTQMPPLGSNVGETGIGITVLVHEQL